MACAEAKCIRLFDTSSCKFLLQPLEKTNYFSTLSVQVPDQSGTLRHEKDSSISLQPRGFHDS